MCHSFIHSFIQERFIEQGFIGSLVSFGDIIIVSETVTVFVSMELRV